MNRHPFRSKPRICRGDPMFQASEIGSDGEQASLAALFIGFLQVSLCQFGGGLVWARRIVVERRQWMDDREFAETLTLCQLMPGPNIVGIAVCVGTKLRGALGAGMAVAGFILVPWMVGLILGSVALRHAELAVVQNTLGGLSAAAAGLLIGTGLQLLLPHRLHWTGLAFAASAFLAMVCTRLPLPIVLLGLAPLSIAAAGLQSARAR
jgi:chromate transporter